MNQVKTTVDNTHSHTLLLIHIIPIYDIIYVYVDKQYLQFHPIAFVMSPRILLVDRVSDVCMHYAVVARCISSTELYRNI